MSSSSKPVIAVTGATGQQGGSVVRFLLADGGFQVRAITRNIDSPSAVGESQVQSQHSFTLAPLAVYSESYCDACTDSTLDVVFDSSEGEGC